MNTALKIGLATAVICMAAATTGAVAQDNYSNYGELTDRLERLASDHSGFAQLESLAETRGGRQVWLLRVGSGETENHPGLAVIGGAKGSHILGSELSLQFAERLLNETPDDSLQALLERTTFYIVPRLNPDATEQYFAGLQYERNGNARETDDDRDGRLNEDGYEDLNGDGMITLMRVSDRTGKWRVHEDDPRVMVESDINQGEKGSWSLYSEGRDNDNDGSFNEDGEGGVDLNKNFTFDYPNFEPGAGEHMLSETENRGLLDFLYEEAMNTFAVVSFGPANNLSSPVSFNQSGISKRVIDGWYREDTEMNRLVSDLYNETTGLTGAPRAGGQPGDLFQWAYFHYGRLSFSTPGWWTPETPSEGNGGRGNGNGDNEQVKYLRWADSQNIDAFVDWEEIDHPDFPGRTVEVGGIKPFHNHTPPYSAVDSLAEKHTQFLLDLADLQPSVELVNVTTEPAGSGLTRVTADIYNSGTLPTASRLGERTRWVRDVMVQIQTGDGLSLVSGDRQRMIDSIEGDGSERMSWLIRGSGSFTLRAGSPVTGFSTIEQTINQ